METMLHAVINRPGVYDGFSANYSGAGFSGMRFKFHGLESAGFDRWVATAKASGRTLDRAAYTTLARPRENVPVMRLATVANGPYSPALHKIEQASWRASGFKKVSIPVDHLST